jgi:hypothetical protein
MKVFREEEMSAFSCLLESSNQVSASGSSAAEAGAGAGGGGCGGGGGGGDGTPSLTAGVKKPERDPAVQGRMHIELKCGWENMARGHPHWGK